MIEESEEQSIFDIIMWCLQIVFIFLCSDYLALIEVGHPINKIHREEGFFHNGALFQNEAGFKTVIDDRLIKSTY